MIHEGNYPRPNYKEFYVYNNQEDVHVDITVEKRKNTIIWGHVHTPTNLPINGAFVELFKYMPDHVHKWAPFLVTYTNPEGYYQFALPPGSAGKYLIKADVPGEVDEYYDLRHENERERRHHLEYHHYDAHPRGYQYNYNYDYDYDYDHHPERPKPHNCHENFQYFEERHHTGSNHCDYSKKYRKNNIYYH